MQTTYTLDGTTTRFTFDWPYLDRSHIMVTVDLAPRGFRFINDHTIECKTLFGEPFPDGTLKVFRATPDLDAYADFKEAATLTAHDLNRARLQCLYLIQERSGGLGGSVGQAVSNLTNEIETVSGALDTLGVSMGVLTAGLQTLDELGTRITTAVNEGAALRDALDLAIAEFDTTTGSLETRMDSLEATQGNLQASVSTQIATLANSTEAQAARIDSVVARVDGLGDSDDDLEDVTASIIMSAIAHVKNGTATARRVDALEAEGGAGVRALIQVEQEARVAADAAFATQITTLQAEIDGSLAALEEEMTVTADAVGNLNAQWVMKASVTRPDGKPVMAGIGLAATSNGDISASEIVMRADRLVFVPAADLSATPKPIMAMGLVDGSPTLIVASNTLGDRSYPGRILVDGSIEARSIKANEITGDKLKAGTITTREIDVSLGSNILKNGSLVTSDGWGTWQWGGAGHVHSVNGAGMAWTPANGSALTIQQPNNWGGAGADWHTAFPVVPGERYEFSVYTAAHRCTVELLVEFRNSAEAATGIAYGTEQNAGELPGGMQLSGYKRLHGFAVAPAGSSHAYLIVRKHSTYPGNSDSWLMFAQPMVAVAGPNQTRPSPWGASGLGTKISAAGISTPSLSAITGNMGVLTAGKVQSPDGLFVIDLDNKFISITV